MSKLDEAWAVLKRLPKREQVTAAQAILDFARGAEKFALNDEQAATVRSRLREKNPKHLTPAALRTRVKKLHR